MAFNLELAAPYEELIQRLIATSHLRSKREVIENALTLLGWAAAEAESGRSIASVDDSRKKYREIHMPILANAKLQAAQKVAIHA